MATKRQAKKQDAMKAKTVQVAEAVADIKETTEEKVAEVAKATAEKVAEVKKVTEEKVAEVKKVTEEKVTEVKKAAKKAAPKKDIKTTLIVEYQGKQVGDKEMIAAVKKAWTKTGKKIGDIKSMTLYVKPEEAAVYYVINDTETGKVEF